jgi:hypothetical protein
VIELKQSSDNNILYATVHGKLTDDDYEDVLVPAIENKLKAYDKIRILVHMGDDFDSVEGEAAWEDAKVGLKHFTSFERTAIVSDRKWIRRSIKVFGFLVPGEVRLFSNDQLAEAEEWIAQ